MRIFKRKRVNNAASSSPFIRTRHPVSIFALPWSIVIFLSSCLDQLPALYPLHFQCQDVYLRIPFMWSFSPASLPGTSSSFSSQPLSSFMPVDISGCIFRVSYVVAASTFLCWMLFQLFPAISLTSCYVPSHFASFCFVFYVHFLPLPSSLSVPFLWSIFVKCCLDLSQGDEVTLP